MAGGDEVVTVNHYSHSHNTPLYHSFLGELATSWPLPRVIGFLNSEHVLLYSELWTGRLNHLYSVPTCGVFEEIPSKEPEHEQNSTFHANTPLASSPVI